jgi:hypothetical protein
MRNPFRNKSFKPQKQDDYPPQEPIKEPWNRKAGEKSISRSGKTVVGKKTDKPYLDQRDERSSFGSGYQCPECSYPLISQVSMNTPCPNCGFSGERKEAVEKPVHTPNRTINFSNLSFGKLSGERKFSLINESNPDMSINADLGENDEVILNREVLDPDNPSISGEGHILLRENKGLWTLKDISSNGATFIQALNYQALQDGIRIILGTRIFRFSTGLATGAKPESKGNKTMQFGQFSLNHEQSSSFTLIDEIDGVAKNFNGQKIELNRFNLEPDDHSISSKLHASIEKTQDKWKIIDKSSNKATFVQVLQEVALTDHIRLILGNKVFRFEIG